MRTIVDMYLIEFAWVGFAGADTFCLLGAVEGVLLLDFCFTLWAALALKT